MTMLMERIKFMEMMMNQVNLVIHPDTSRNTVMANDVLLRAADRMTRVMMILLKRLRGTTSCGATLYTCLPNPCRTATLVSIATTKTMS